jgi:hypothetical protein
MIEMSLMTEKNKANKPKQYFDYNLLKYVDCKKDA